MSEQTKIKTFQDMMNMDIKDYVFEKEGKGKKKLSYISWAKAVELANEVDANFSYEFVLFDNGQGRQVPYMYDEKVGYMVMTKVTMLGVTKTMIYTVMDSHNLAVKEVARKVSYKSGDVTVPAVDMFAVSKAWMRCLVKNIAMFGLGLKLYQGEDVEDEKEEKEEVKMITADQVKKIKELQARLGFTDVYMEKSLKGKKVEELNTNQAEELIKGFTKMVKEREEKEAVVDETATVEEENAVVEENNQ